MQRKATLVDANHIDSTLPCHMGDAKSTHPHCHFIEERGPNIVELAAELLEFA